MWKGKSPPRLNMEDASKVTDAAVRLVCRYSNGIMESTVARAITMKGAVLRVMSRTSYEMGVQVTVMAAFLPRTTPGQVTAILRGEEPGTWVVDLRLRSVAMPLATAAPVESETAPILEMREAAVRLAKRLDAAGWIPFFNAAFERSSPTERPAMLAATEMAVFALLEERDLAGATELLARIGERSQ
jgi:hypothetical protein